jgi:hypothetical protein
VILDALQEAKGGGPAHPEGSLDGPRRHNRVLAQEVDEGQGIRSCLGRRDLPIALTQLEDPLRTLDRIGGLGLDRRQEQLDPGKRLPGFPYGLEAVAAVLSPLL